MLKEHERRRYLESLGEEQRKEAEKKLEEQQRRHREHPKVNVPVRTPIPSYPPHLQFSKLHEKVAEKLQLPADLEAKKPLFIPSYQQGLLGFVVFLVFLL